MLTEFRMPALGADMEAGTVAQWSVEPGATVHRGDVVAVVETDKGAIDVEIFLDGVLREIVVPVGERVPVGTVLARVETVATAAVEAVPTTLAPAAEAPVAAAVAVPAAVTAAEPASTAAAGVAQVVAGDAPRAKVSPAARVLARELGVDVAAIRGSGPGGAITREDVQRAAAAASGPAASGPAAGEGGGMRAAIAAAMSRSKREIPHYYLSLTRDVGAATAWLAAHNAAVPPAERLLFVALLVKALALACREVEGFSGFYRDGRFDRGDGVHVGVAVALRGGGLVAPAIPDPGGKSLLALMAEFRALVMRARAGRLRASELASPTIILTSLGDSAVDAVFPIIQPPQVAIVGAGAVAPRPWVVDGGLAVRELLCLSLGADHRVTDGRLGAQFLARIAQHLDAPEQL